MSFRSADGTTKDRKFDKRDLLRQRLGSAYNERYMAMDDADLRSKINQSPRQKRDHESKQNLAGISSSMNVDQIDSFDPPPWKWTESRVWLNLGPNFVPRHVRSVTCSSNRCWFGHFECRPRNYTIKVFEKKPRNSDPILSFKLKGSTNSTVQRPRFEDYWEKVDKQVTVACECIPWCFIEGTTVCEMKTY